jgi:hypothetical protein
VPEHVDIIILTRDEAPPRPAVAHGIERQGGPGLGLRIIRVVGTRRADDRDRRVAIARARNEGRARAIAPWVMFVDDDVILEPGCVQALLDALKQRPGHAALAADYLGESRVGHPWGGPDVHVAMGATLFRRPALRRIRFRAEPDRCECLCCCEDLRRLGLAIAYLPAARARHEPEASSPGGSPETPPTVLPGRVLAAFDRRHLSRFRRLFLGSLRASGNFETVTAVGYGLYPSERRTLARLPGVELLARPDDGVKPPVRRLRDFQAVVAGWPALTPAAYWDAGDVVFQGSLRPLWAIAAAHPDRLLAVREPFGHPFNPAVRAWTLSIHDREARLRAFHLLSRHPFLNSGFAAGTAAALGTYLREADRLLHSRELRGTSDWGDQTALNLYCHSEPGRWHEVEEGWNYCVHDRKRGALRIGPDGRIIARSGTPIHVAHGNAMSLPQFVLAP